MSKKISEVSGLPSFNKVQSATKEKKFISISSVAR